MKELLDNGKCGLLVNPKKPKQIVRAINQFIENPKLRQLMGQKARQRVQDEYNEEKIGKQIEELYSNFTQ